MGKGAGHIGDLVSIAHLVNADWNSVICWSSLVQTFLVTGGFQLIQSLFSQVSIISDGWRAERGGHTQHHHKGT